MIWECADCSHQVVDSNRPGACRFCGEDARFYVRGARGARLRADGKLAFQRSRMARAGEGEVHR